MMRMPIHSTDDGTLLFRGASGAFRSSCLTEGELLALLQQQCLKVASVKGTPILSLLFGWMRGIGLLKEEQSERLAEVHRLLGKLATSDAMRCCHVIAARQRETGLCA
jgi:hypothetical protein